MPARHEQIGERAGHEQAMGVLFEAATTHLDETNTRLMTPIGWFDPRLREGRFLALTSDLLRFFARSLSFTVPLWR
jgi:hypothetical protein